MDGSSPVRDMFTALQIHRLFLVVDVSCVTTSIEQVTDISVIRRVKSEDGLIDEDTGNV